MEKRAMPRRMIRKSASGAGACSDQHTFPTTQRCLWRPAWRGRAAHFFHQR